MKNLPDSTGSDSGYTTGSVDMTSNIMLLHMDEASWNGTSDEVVDSSGNGNHGTASGDATTAVGLLDNAGTFDGTGDYISIADADALDLTGNFTLSLWVKQGNSSGHAFYITKKESNYQATAGYQWYWSDYQGGTVDFIGKGGDYERASLTREAGWHHHAVVMDSGSVTLYYDGSPISSSGYTNGSLTAGTDELWIQRKDTGQGGYGYGDIDEFAIWSTALTDEDIVAIFRRGANKLKYQVRSCDDDACSGESFAGPDGTGSTYYSELTSAENGLPSKTLSNVDDNRYFQYKAYFETSDSTVTPELLDVTVSYSTGGGGVPEFSDALYIVTMLFGVYYVSRTFQRPQEV